MSCSATPIARLRRFHWRSAALLPLLGPALVAACGESPSTAPTATYYVYDAQLNPGAAELGVGSAIPLVVGRSKACMSGFCGMEYMDAQWTSSDSTVIALQPGTVTDMFGDVAPGVYVVGKRPGNAIVTAHVGGKPTKLVMVR